MAGIWSGFMLRRSVEAGRCSCQLLVPWPSAGARFAHFSIPVDLEQSVMSVAARIALHGPVLDLINQGPK
jgi:hypothetical protein